MPRSPRAMAMIRAMPARTAGTAPIVRNGVGPAGCARIVSEHKQTEDEDLGWHIDLLRAALRLRGRSRIDA